MLLQHIFNSLADLESFIYSKQLIKGGPGAGAGSWVLCGPTISDWDPVKLLQLNLAVDA